MPQPETMTEAEWRQLGERLFGTDLGGGRLYRQSHAARSASVPGVPHEPIRCPWRAWRLVRLQASGLLRVAAYSASHEPE